MTVMHEGTIISCFNPRFMNGALGFIHEHKVTGKSWLDHIIRYLKIMDTHSKNLDEVFVSEANAIYGPYLRPLVFGLDGGRRLNTATDRATLSQVPGWTKRYGYLTMAFHQRLMEDIMLRPSAAHVHMY